MKHASSLSLFLSHSIVNKIVFFNSKQPNISINDQPAGLLAQLEIVL